MGIFDIYETSIIDPIKFNEHISQKFKSSINHNDINYSIFIHKDSILKTLNLKNQYIDMDELIKDIGYIDPRVLLREPIELNTYFDCPFVIKSLGWFSSNSKNKIRYFSKYEEKTVYLDTLDILQFLFRSNNISTVLNIIIKYFKIIFTSDSWISYQRVKYMNNFQLIHSISTNNKFKQNYPALSSLLIPCLKLYETLNVIGNLHLGKKEYIYKSNNVFFVSNTYLSTFCQLHQSTTNRMLNLLCCLGVICKVPKNHLNAELINNSKKIAQSNNVKDTISFYSIPNLEDLCDFIEETAINLYYNNINHTNITKKAIAKVLGENIINKVYFNSKINEDSNTNNINYEFILNFIITTIKTKTFCSKNDIEQRILRDFEKKVTWRMIKDEVIEKCLKVNIKYTKPTNEIKNKLNLKSSSYIFINC